MHSFVHTIQSSWISFRSLSLVLAVAAVGVVHAAQPYGLEPPRPAVTPYLNMPQSLPQPSGTFSTVNAFPSLTFQNAVFLTQAPRSNQLYVCEREGRLYSFYNDPGTTTKTLVLDLTAKTQGWDDCGFLGLAFHPEFGLAGSPNRGFFFVFYQYSASPVPGPNRPPSATPAYNRLARFTIPDGSIVADPNSELILINQHDQHVWHNGGNMFFHPVDGFLYMPIGDEGGANDSYNSGQKINDKLLSGMFRIDVDMRGGSISHPIRRQPQSYSGRPASTANYYVPDDNPWQSPTGANLEEFWAIGVRSPHRSTHDPVTNKIFLGDVGQGAWEEVSVIEKGGNYQWPYMEGNHTGPKAKPSPLIGVDKPAIWEYQHVNATLSGNCVVGGYVYRGAQHADLVGKYIFGDNTYGRIWVMDLSTNPVTVSLLCTMSPNGSNYTGLSSFGLDAAGEIYMCKMNHTSAGGIYKFARSGTTGPAVPAALSQTGAFTSVASLTTAAGLIPFKVGSPLWSDGALKTRWIALASGEQVDFAPTGEWTFPSGTVFVKHFELVVNEVTGQKKRLETRLLVRTPGEGVYGVTYKWRADDSEADLLAAGQNENITVTTATGTRTHTHTYPSRQECLSCHNAQAQHVLGVKTRQLNCDFTYPSTGIADNQLRTWNHLGMLNPALDEQDIPTLASMVPVDDAGATLEHRVRSYIDANCSHCHRPGNVQAFFDARYDVPLDQQGLIEGPVGNTLGIDGAVVVKPQDVSRSILRVRDGSLTASIKMPPLAKNSLDDPWMAVLDQWISGLGGMPTLQPPAISPAGGTYEDAVVVSLSHSDSQAALYFTVDGSIPTTGSFPYAGPFSLEVSATVKAKAFRTGFVDSATASETYDVVTYRDPENPSPVTSGVRYGQYLGTWSALPDFTALTPAETGARATFNISPRLQNDNFAFEFEGFIDAPAKGVYTFYTNSDDGSQLFIGTTMVVQNDGLHPPQEASGTIPLKAGRHAIRVTMFESGGGEVLDVSWAGPGIAKTIVPAGALFRMKDPATVTLSGLAQVYDGTPRVVAATTNPAGLSVDVTYEGSGTAPTNAGSYAVQAVVTDPGYVGSANGTLVVAKADATVTIGNLTQTADGTPRVVAVTTIPAGLAVIVNYNGSASPPVDPGSYAVVATVNDANYQGSSTDTLSVLPPNQPPSASFTAAPTSGPAPLSVSFDASASSDTDGSIASYSWNFGDGANGSGATASHVYSTSGTFTATLTVTDDDGAMATASSTIDALGETVVSVQATDASGAEPSDSATFTVSRTGSTLAAVAVSYTVSGSATAGSDYSALSGTVTIPAGSATAAVTVLPIDDSAVEGTETVVLGLSAGAGYSVDPGQPGAVVSIADNEKPYLTIFTTANTTEGSSSPGIITIFTNYALASDLQVLYTVKPDGTATSGVDYLALSGVLTIPAGALSATIAVVPIDDGAIEPQETVRISIAASPAYTYSTKTRTVYINDNDTPLVSVGRLDKKGSEPGTDTGSFRISRAVATGSVLTVNYAMSNTATNGIDYVMLPGTATIPAGALYVDVIMAPIDDALVEGTEYATLTIAASPAYSISSSNATVTLYDND